MELTLPALHSRIFLPKAGQFSRQVNGFKFLGLNKRENHRVSATLKEQSPGIVVQPDKIIQIHNKKQLDEALKNSGNKLVVIEYGASHSKNCARIYPTVVELSQASKNVDFLLIIADESEETEALCREAKVTKVPYFVFLKQGEVVHEEQGVDPDQLVSDVLFYGENTSQTIDLHGESDIHTLVQDHKEDHKLVVVDVSLKNCGPCAKVWPTVMKLADKMEDTVIFAKLDGTENESCKRFISQMKIREVPTFLFYRDGDLVGKYVGSGRGELIGEVLRYQGVRCT